MTTATAWKRSLTAIGAWFNSIANRWRRPRHLRDGSVMVVNMRPLGGQEIQFETIFLNQVLEDDFMTYCTNTNTLQLFQFIKNVDAHRASTDELERAQLYDKIIVQLHEQPLDTVYDTTLQDMKTRIFPLYIRSDQFRLLVNKQGKSFFYGLIDPSLNHNLPLFNIQYLLNIPYMHDALYRFSVKELSEESIQLYDEILRYKSADTSDQVQIANDIYNTYVRVGSAKEANLTHSIRTQLQVIPTMTEPILDLFDSCIDHLTSSCIYDIYVRFTSTSDFNTCKQGYMDSIIN
jgi:hypothetical protein